VDVMCAAAAASINVTGQCSDSEIQLIDCLNGGICQVITVDEKRMPICGFVALSIHSPLSGPKFECDLRF